MYKTFVTPSNDPSGAEAGALREVRFEYSREFPRVLDQLHAALVISTYQAGKLVVVGVHEGQLTFAFHNFEGVMGVAVGPRRIAVGTRRQVYFLHAAHELAANIQPRGTHDACWLTRNSLVTGNIHGHELAWGEDGLWVVNTLFSSLCTLHEDYSFVPRWRPPFITELASQDRCHLNGLAMHEGKPRFVTAHAETNDPAGWRAVKDRSGCVVDVASGRSIVRGLCMPHSPRWHEGRLWTLDSGTGRLVRIDPERGEVEPVERFPGYARGLSLRGRFALVGLSKIRETSVFGDIPIAEHREELRCGVAAVDLATGRTVAWLQFHSGVDEIFAVDVLPDCRNPVICGPSAEEDGRSDIWLVPPEDRVPAGGSAFTPGPSEAKAKQAAAELKTEGVQLHEQGRLAESLDRLCRAAELDGTSPDIQNHLGNLRQDLGDQTAALECYRRALRIRPDFAPAHQNLGYVFASWGEADDGLRHFDLAQRAQPQPMNRLLTATILPVIYDSVDDVAHWRRRLTEQVQCLVADGVRIDTTSTLVPTSFFMAYQGENDREVMRSLARVYEGVQCCEPASGSQRPTGRRIKVGFLSAYFRDHTIGRLNLERIRRLSRDDFEVTIISAVHARHEPGNGFRQAADHYVTVPRHVAGARRQIASLGLDILFFADVGMDTLTQTLAYSRMAPIQCVTWGHPDTTGSPAIDYFISSELLETGEADSHYTERLVRLPNLGTYYQRPQRSEPALTREFFGLDPRRHVYLCPQTLFKFHPQFDAVLAGVLEADPQGDLVLLEGRVPNWTERLKHRLAGTLGEAAARVRFLPAQAHADFMELLALADVVLDPFPFGGGNSSYEALAVDSPVVTWPSPYLRGRITLALYRKMGWTDCAVSSADAYVALAVRLACDAAYRQSVRDEIRAASPVLFEDPEEVRALETFFRQAVEGTVP